MIFFYNSNGTLIKVAPDHVYQGSDGATTLYFVAPIVSTAVINVAFTLPNGERTAKHVLTPYSGELNGITDGDGNTYKVWAYDLDGHITAYAGNVAAQFFITISGVLRSTQAANFTVELGVPPVIEPPEGDSYDELIKFISDIISGNITFLNFENGAGDYALVQKAASGEENTATYEGAIVLGKNNKALNKRAFVGGSSNTGAGHTSFTYGQLITNRGGVTTAFGKEHVIAPDPDVENNTAVPQENFLAGHHNVIYASDRGGAVNFIAGLNNVSRGSYGTIFGSDNFIPAGKQIRLANSDYIGAFILGAFADADKINLLFAIGNGNYDPSHPDNRKRQNALEVYYNGKVKVYKAPEDNEDVVRKQELDTKQNALIFDTTPTAGSDNPVTSGGIKSAIDGAISDLNIKNGTQNSLVQKGNEKTGSGSNIALFGTGNRATYWDNTFVIGRYNSPSPTNFSDPAIFQIGWGSSNENRANVFEVTRSGCIRLPNFTSVDATTPSGYKTFKCVNGVLTAID